MNAQTKATFIAVVLVGILFVLSNAFFVLQQTEQALVLQFGRPIKVEQEAGLKWKIPFVQNVEFFDKRLLDFNAEPKEVTAADQKRLIVDAFVRYRIVDPLRFKQTVGTEATMRLRLNSYLESSLKQVLGKVPLAAIVSEQRTHIMEEVRGLVNAQAAGAQLDENGNVIPGNEAEGFGIEVADLRIMRADLPQANSESIYRRMQTEREREAKQFRAQGAEDAQKIRAEAEKERTILIAEANKKAQEIRGQGDREATRIFAEAYGQDADFFKFYRTMQAYRKTLSPKDTTLVLSPQDGFLDYLGKGVRAER